MKILLIDVDSKIPNLALMQISSYYKSKGHEVGFNVTDPDKVYISCIFKKNGDQARGIATKFQGADVYIGGSGVNFAWLPEEMEKVKPDYDIYPNIDYSLGFTTRGCFRNCPFCIVPEKEGKLHQWQHIREFYESKFDNVTLLDNNVYADKKWFFENTDFIIDNNLTIDITQGMDIRLIDREIAQRISELKFKLMIKFAFDSINDEKAVKYGIELLRKEKVDLRNRTSFYVLVGYNTTPEEDKYRCRLLKELGTNPFVMKYVNNKWTNKIAWWANRKQVFWTSDIDELDYRKQRRPTEAELRSMELQTTLI